MNFHADIQARAAERARLDAATAAFLAAGNSIKHLPGPGEQTAGTYRGAPTYLPAGEQTQHIHRQPKGRQKALDAETWQTRQALVERYGERIKACAARGFSERGAAMELRISRTQVRMVAAAVGVTLPSMARKTKVAA